jgi:choline dehydrogenase-like flavoprotein
VLDYNSSVGNQGTVGALGIAEDLMRREQLLNASAFFVWRKDYKVDDRYFSKGALSLTHVMDTLNHTNAPGLNFFRNLKTALRHGDNTFNIMAKRMKGMIHPKNWIAIRAQIETVPNPHSRVTLSKKKDNLGVNKLTLDWRLTQQDLNSFRKFQETLFNFLQINGINMRVFNHELDEAGWPVTMISGKHHMGTTRMHSDPKKGAVDPNCRVHGVANLFIAGSSVFPTSGQANPMLTIVALAIRLAEHVKRIINHR